MRGIGAGTRIFELLDRKPAIAPNQGIEVDPSHRGVIRFENVGFEYPSRKGVQILDEFNLEIGVGENVAIVYVIARAYVILMSCADPYPFWMGCSGKSGGGKSSVQSLLLRYYDPVRGKVTFDGQGASAHGVAFFFRPVSAAQRTRQTFVNSTRVLGETLLASYHRCALRFTSFTPFFF